MPLPLPTCSSLTSAWPRTRRQGYALMTGDVAAVNAAVEAGSTAAAESGLLVSKVVIPSPAETVFEQIA